MRRDQAETLKNNLPTKDVTLLLDLLNCQLGVCGSLLVEKYHQLRKQDFLNRYAEFVALPDDNEQVDEEISEMKPDEAPIVKDHASLANILTQIQYDLFDLRMIVVDPDFDQTNSRINDQGVFWLENISNKIFSQFSDFPEQLLPIGNQLATNFFLARTWCDHVCSAYDANEYESHKNHATKYLSVLSRFLIIVGCWLNVTHKDKVWTWSPKSEDSQEASEEQTEASK